MESCHVCWIEDQIRLKFGKEWSMSILGDSRLCGVTDESSGGVRRTLILSSPISTKCLLGDKWRHDIRLLSGNHSHLKLTEKKLPKAMAIYWPDYLDFFFLPEGKLWIRNHEKRQWENIAPSFQRMHRNLQIKSVESHDRLWWMHKDKWKIWLCYHRFSFTCCVHSKLGRSWLTTTFLRSS